MKKYISVISGEVIGIYQEDDEWVIADMASDGINNIIARFTEYSNAMEYYDVLTRRAVVVYESQFRELFILLRDRRNENEER